MTREDTLHVVTRLAIAVGSAFYAVALLREGTVGADCVASIIIVLALVAVGTAIPIAGRCES